MSNKKKRIIIGISAVSIFFAYWLFSYCILRYSTSSSSIPPATTNITNEDTLEMECIAYMLFSKDFTIVTTSKVEEKIDDTESFFLYTGRMTCPWCRILVPVLNEIAINNSIEIFYLDSEETERDFQLKNFRDKYEIDSVPSLIYFDEAGTAHIIEHNISSDNFSEEQLEEEILVYLNLEK